MGKQRFIVSVSVIVYKHDKSLLVTERSKKEEQGSGLLAYPGGKIDDFKVKDINEVKHNILQEAAKRELLEECGVEIDGEFKLLNNHAFQRFDGDYALMVVFIAKLKSQKEVELDKDEIQAIHWLRFEDIDKSQMYDSVYKVYKLANKYLQTLK